MKKIFRTLKRFWASLWMENTLYYNILERLDKKGIGLLTNIRPFVNKNLKANKKLYGTEFTANWNNILDLFRLMKRNKHITYDEAQFSNEEFLAGGEIAFNVSLTYIGAEYFNTLKLTKKTIKNFNITKWLTLGALSVSAGSLWYAVHRDNSLETKLKPLQLQLEYLKSQEKARGVNIPIKIDTIHLTTQKTK